MRADQADGADHRAGTAGAWYRPMVARPTDEEHRSATVLELFFDLCFVVAVAQAAFALHHEVAEDHVARAWSATPRCSSPSGGRG